MMPFTRPVVLVHGYSDKGQSFESWRQALIALGAQPVMVNVCTYISLNNEVTITDIGEALDRALEYQLKGEDGESRVFDAIVLQAPAARAIVHQPGAQHQHAGGILPDAVSQLLYFLDDKGNPPSRGNGGWLSRIL